MRAFFGLPVPAPVNSWLTRAVGERARILPPAAWVRPENRHVTLVFLGNIERPDLASFDRLLAPRLATEDFLALELTDCGTFPADRPARVVWIGLRPSRALLGLRTALVRCSRELGFDVERREFVPHLTLARCRKPWPRGACRDWRRRGLRPESAEEGERFRVSSVRLFESRFGPQGVQYRSIRSYPLGGASQPSKLAPLKLK